MMHKIFLGLMLIAVTVLLADSFSIETDMGGMTVTIEEGSSGKAEVNVIDEIATRLEKLETKYNTNLNKLDQKRTDKLINEIYELLAMLPDNLSFDITSVQSNQNTQSTTTSMNIDIQMTEDNFDDEPVTEVKMEMKSAMSESEFRKLKSNVENEDFADDQTSVVRIAAKSKYFNIDQLIRLLDVFSFEEDKIELVRIVYPQVVDPDNAHNLLGAFTYSDDKEEVEEIINQ
jgi:Domain of unknown function (DUF4476)